MEKYDFFKKDGVRPFEEQLRLTRLFYQNAPEIYAHFNEWKDIDKFYFIPLHMEMTYRCGGWVAEMAPDPVWLGSFVRCTLEHPELFESTKLPKQFIPTPLTYSRRLKPGDSWMLTHHAVQGTVLLVLSKSATPRR